MNRHYYSEAPEIWASYEHLLKERLESIDYLAQRMFTDLQIIGMKKDDIYAFMRENFAALWERVAAEQEPKGRGKA